MVKELRGDPLAVLRSSGPLVLLAFLLALPGLPQRDHRDPYDPCNPFKGRPLGALEFPFYLSLLLLAFLLAYPGPLISLKWIIAIPMIPVIPSRDCLPGPGAQGH